MDLFLGQAGDTWPGLGTAGSEMAMVSPPPGVSSGFSVPRIALGQAAGHREPEPHAGGTTGVAEPLEGHERPVPFGLGDAWPAIDNAELDLVAVGTRRQQAAAIRWESTAVRFR